MGAASQMHELGVVYSIYDSGRDGGTADGFAADQGSFLACSGNQEADSDGKARDKSGQMYFSHNSLLPLAAVAESLKK
jgi:hypothetical protein